MGSVIAAHTSLAASRHVGSSQTRDQTRVPCIGRWVLNHWTPREVLSDSLIDNTGLGWGPPMEIPSGD